MSNDILRKGYEMPFKIYQFSSNSTSVSTRTAHYKRCYFLNIYIRTNINDFMENMIDVFIICMHFEDARHVEFSRYFTFW